MSRAIRSSREHKYAVTSVNSSVSTSGSLYAMSNTVFLGTGDDNRTGSRIRVNGFFARCYLSQADTPTQLVRSIVFWSKSLVTSGQLPTVHGHFDPNLGYLYEDKTFVFNVSITAVGQVQYLEHNVQVKGISDFGHDDTNTVPITGHLNWWIVSDSAVIPHVALYGDVGIRFQEV